MLLVSYLRRQCQIQDHEDLPLCVLLRVLYSFNSYIYAIDSFRVSFCTQCEIGIQLYSLSCGNLVVPTPFIAETILAPLNGLGMLIESQLAVDVRLYFWTLSSIPLVYMSVLMPGPHCHDYHHFEVSFV